MDRLDTRWATATVVPPLGTAVPPVGRRSEVGCWSVRVNITVQSRVWPSLTDLVSGLAVTGVPLELALG